MKYRALALIATFAIVSCATTAPRDVTQTAFAAVEFCTRAVENRSEAIAFGQSRKIVQLGVRNNETQFGAIGQSVPWLIWTDDPGFDGVRFACSMSGAREMSAAWVKSGPSYASLGA